MRLVDALHAAGIGCIIDFVPVHFATDAWGLADYDGTPLFEYPHADVGVSEWGSRNFMHSRGETCSFLQSSANFWLGAYHFDGIRLDAISRIVYWQGDEARGVNGMAVDFVKTFNNGLRSLNLSDKPVERTFRIEGATSATMLVDTDWERYGGSTPDAEGRRLPCDEDGILVGLPACSGKLVAVGNRLRPAESGAGQGAGTRNEQAMLL